MTSKANPACPMPFFPIVFPRDNAPHNSDVSYKVCQFTEWWYFNGKLVTDAGTYGIFITFPWSKENEAAPMAWEIIVQLEDVANQKVYTTGRQKLPPGSVEIGSNQTLDLSVKAPVDFHLEQLIFSDRNLPPNFILEAAARTEDGAQLELELRLRSEKPALLLRTSTDSSTPGYDPFGGGDDHTYYYSLTQLAVAMGSVKLPGTRHQRIDPARSLMWMDHQWGNFYLTSSNTDWYWFSVQLDNGYQVNAALLPIDGEWIAEVNISDPAGNDQVMTSLSSPPVTITVHTPPGKQKPTGAELVFTIGPPNNPVEVELSMVVLVPTGSQKGLWERLCRVTGTFGGDSISGQGYIERP